jgi:hypothetical protein
MNNSGAWIKFVIFALVAIMLASVVSVFLDPGMGDPAKQTRSRHPAGFSAAVPRGWGATIFTDPRGRGDFIRMAPERVTGQSPSLGFGKLPETPEVAGKARDVQFQGQPARLVERKTSHLHTYALLFERDGVPFRIDLSSPLPLDPLDSVYRPFIESFQTEKTIEVPASAIAVPASTAPATLPATLPFGPMGP